MNKIAIRLLVISLLVAVVIVFFLNRLLNKPSHLIEVIPSSAVAVVHINTREIAKDIYLHGGFTLDSLHRFNREFPYFKSVIDPRTTGINVYTELYLFQDKVDNGTYNCLLFNLNNLKNFKQFCSSNGLLTKVNVENEEIYYSSRDSFYVWIRNKEAALLFQIRSNDQLDQVIHKLNNSEVSEQDFKEVLTTNDNLQVWQKNSNSLLHKDFPFFKGESWLKANFKPGKMEYTGHTTRNTFQMELPGLLNPKFNTENKNSFEGEIAAPQAELHPLSYIINQWHTTK